MKTLSKMMMLLLATAMVGCGELTPEEMAAGDTPESTPSLLEASAAAAVDQVRETTQPATEPVAAPEAAPAPDAPLPASANIVVQAAPTTTIDLTKGRDESPRESLENIRARSPNPVVVPALQGVPSLEQPDPTPAPACQKECPVGTSFNTATCACEMPDAPLPALPVH